MNYKIVIFSLYLIFVSGCKQVENTTKKEINIEPKFEKKEVEIKKTEKELKKEKEKVIEEDDTNYIFDRDYKNQGFALIYNEDLFTGQKIDNNSLSIFHKKIKKNSFVKITNPFNDLSITAKVVSNKIDYPEFYNSVITQRIVEELSIDINEPYIDLSLISNDSTFIAKKAKTYDEEKMVAEKAPVDGIIIDNLGTIEKKDIKIIKKSFLYSIVIADFYFKDSAEIMLNRIKEETNINNPVIKKLSQTKYRVLLGPFNDIKKLEESFNEIKPLNFENLKILKDV
ncbi:hypothetical protein [Candidatus Pelagibacter sp. HIMB1623]|uniref:hypothetical protein n=1 Tax=Candidatus Pelagibacter sp. HIMB1623 TaxID=3413358 RepID=UPI003F829687